MTSKQEITKPRNIIERGRDFAQKAQGLSVTWMRCKCKHSRLVCHCFRLRNMRPGNVNIHLQQVVAQHQMAPESGATVAVTEKQIRVRFSPLRSETQDR